jgi:hypothetical protein
MSRSTERSAEAPTPYFVPETSSVCFQVHACGVPVVAFVTRDWLQRRFGPVVPEGPRLVEAYVEHAAEIDVEVARRYAQGRLEPIWLASAFLPDDA